MSAADARELIGELDRERLGEEDLVSLPAHHCYVRATVDGQREPTYYLELLKPERGDPQVAERIRAAMADYTTPAEALASQDSEAHRQVKDFRDKLDQEEDDAASGPAGNNPVKPPGNGTGGGGANGKKPRTRRRGEEPTGPGAPVCGSE